MREFAPEADVMVAVHPPLALAWQLTPPLYGTIADLYGVPFILLSGALWYWVGRTWERWMQGGEFLHFSWLPARIATNLLFLVTALFTGIIAVLLGIQVAQRRFESDWHTNLAVFILRGGLYLTWSAGLMAVAIRDLRRWMKASKQADVRSDVEFE
jgi:hypothetical protein